MTLYVVQVPDPPAGADWSYTVPGRYLELITGVTATLDTLGVPTSMVDASGNGNTGGYFAGVVPFEYGEPGIVPGDLAVGIGIPTFDPHTYAVFPITATGTGAGVTMCWWMSVGAKLTIGSSFPGASGISIDRDALTWAMSSNSATFSGVFVDPAPGAPVLVTWVWPTPGFGSALIYLNNTVIATHVINGAQGVIGSNPWQIGGGTISPTALQSHVIVDELATFLTELTPANVALLVANGNNWTNYEAAVFSRTPEAYYHLNDVPATGAGRTPILQVTDGTDVVEAIASGFPAVTTPGPYDYNWTPDLASSSQSPDGELTTVAIPKLILPAGYTIGTNTPDIESTDQWSDVTLWWSDSVQQATTPIEPYDYPPGALLVYQQIGTTP